MTAPTFHVQPLSPACGAEVTGIDLTRADAATLQAVDAALATHGVLFFRGQRLTPEQQVAVTQRFGPVLRVPYIRHLDAHPDIIAVLKEADERRISTFGGTWHSDFSFLDEPPSLTLLYAIELPAVGGDTLWASQYAAYDALSPGMQRLLDPPALRADRLATRHPRPGHRRTGQPLDRHGARRPGGRPRGLAPGGAGASGDRAPGAVRQPGLQPAFRGHERSRVPAPVAVPVPACRQPRVLLPPALGTGHARGMGQPLPDASGHQ